MNVMVFFLYSRTLIEIYLHIINAVAMLINQIKTTLTDLDEVILYLYYLS